VFHVECLHHQCRYWHCVTCRSSYLFAHQIFRACSAVVTGHSAPLWYQGPVSWVRTRPFPQSMLHASSWLLNEAEYFCTPDLMGHVLVAGHLFRRSITPLASSPCSCQSRLLINVYAGQVCRLCPPIHALFQCDLPSLPCSVSPRRRPHCCMPVAPPGQRSTVPAPNVTCPTLFLLLAKFVPGPTRQSHLSSARSTGLPPDQGGKPCNSMLLVSFAGPCGPLPMHCHRSSGCSTDTCFIFLRAGGQSICPGAPPPPYRDPNPSRPDPGPPPPAPAHWSRANPTVKLLSAHITYTRTDSCGVSRPPSLPS
jgi:hypothetical protein